MLRSKKVTLTPLSVPQRSIMAELQVEKQASFKGHLADIGDSNTHGVVVHAARRHYTKEEHSKHVASCGAREARKSASQGCW